MKKQFSTAWKSSKQPRKQRKYVANAPLNIKKKFVSINLTKEIRKKTNKRNISARKGDVVKILRGKFKGKQGKIIKVKLKISKIIVEGIQVKKQDGSKASVALQPSNLKIIELNLEDKKRRLNRNIIKKEENKKITNIKPGKEKQNELKKTENS